MYYSASARKRVEQRGAVAYTGRMNPQAAEDRFCMKCGAPLGSRQVEDRVRPACPRCGWVVYYEPKLVALGVLVHDGKVLMVRRAMEPGLGLWSLPAGYVNRGEVVEEAVAREVREETGLDVRVRQLLGLFSQPGRPIVLAAYDVELAGGTLCASPELLDLGFFPLDALPELAFPWDTRILDCWKNGNKAAE